MFHAVYALPDPEKVYRILRSGEDFKTDNLTEFGIVCSKFHPFDSGVKDHENDLEFMKIVTEEDEFLLYEKYFQSQAPTPHFHVYDERLIMRHKSNTKSLAINYNKLIMYVKDLFSAYQDFKDKKISSPILKYDLGMPYLAMVQGKIACNTEVFMCDFRQIMEKYNKTNKQDEAVRKVIDMTNVFEEKISKVDSDEEGALLKVYEMIKITEEASKFLSVEDQLRLIRDFGDSGSAAALTNEPVL